MHKHLPQLILLTALLLAGCGGTAQSTPTSPPVVTPTPSAVSVAVGTATPAATVEVTGNTPAPATTETPDTIAGPTTTPRSAGPVDPATGDDPKVDAIVEEVSDLRGLEILESVNLEYMTRDQLRERMMETLDEEYTPAEAEADTRVLAAFGLVPEDLDMRELYVDLYTEQVAGFYEPETDDLYVIDSGADMTAMEQLTYAHEVVHALQDQHYDLDALTEPYEDKNDDTTLAISALVEGDATVLQIREYALAHPDVLAGYLSEIEEQGPSSQVLQSAPPIISETLLFPYEAGMNFVMRLRSEGGWEAVDAAYRDVPTSTEQILHPDKYLRRDEPTKLQLPDLGSTLGPGWEEIERNLFGEFQTRILLEGEGRLDEARRAAEGWDADWFALWVNGDQEVLIWQTVWDSTADAEEFVAAMRRYDEARFEGQYTTDGDIALLSAGERTAAIRLQGDGASYVLAPSTELARQVMAVLAP